MVHFENGLCTFKEENIKMKMGKKNKHEKKEKGKGEKTGK